MAIITTLANVHKNRPLKPRYAKTQATAQAVKKAATESTELQVGMVLSRKSDGTVIVDKGSSTPAGLCLTFEKELEIAGGDDVAMLVMGNDAIWALDNYNSAIDSSALATAKSTLDGGGEVLLIAASDGLLKIKGSGDTSAVPVCRLIGIEGTTLLIAGCF